MQMRRLGKTGLLVSEIGFGGWAIGGNAFGNSYGATDDHVSKAAIRCALELGVTLFDTADVYGHGHSEALLSEALTAWEGPPPVVVTKGGINFYRRDDTLEPDWTPLALAHAVQQSLIRLRRETLDVFLLMNPPVEELDRFRVWETLDALKRAGKIRYYGASVADPSDGVWLLKNNLPIDVLEVAYSLFYQGATVELLPLARKRKVGILAREPLANGFLSGKYGPESKFAEGDIRAALPTEYVAAMAETAAQLDFLRRDGVRTPTQAALRFVLDDPVVSSVIVGGKTAAQIEENVLAASVPPIDAAERAKVAGVFAE
jgi:aryl-alcohol dehydrogenase-like predicted oxidoreductase